MASSYSDNYTEALKCHETDLDYVTQSHGAECEDQVCAFFVCMFCMYVFAFCYMF